MERRRERERETEGEREWLGAAGRSGGEAQREKERREQKKKKSENSKFVLKVILHIHTYISNPKPCNEKQNFNQVFYNQTAENNDKKV